MSNDKPKHPGGRPTLYTPELLVKANEYIDGGWEKAGDAVPTVAGLACELNICRDTCYAWGDEGEKPEFSDILRKIAQKQERKLVNGGLEGGFNAAVTKMMLTKHGYSDKQEIDAKGGFVINIIGVQARRF